jgi:DNA-directed RNA polymerase subunit M/transcription elongation factor TFIIS
MTQEKLVVRNYGRFRARPGLWSHGFLVDYLCPKCKRSLNSKCELLDVGDACPNCKAAYDFAEEVKQAYSEFQTKASLKEMQKHAEHLVHEQQATERRQREAAVREEQSRLSWLAAEDNRIANADAKVAKRRQLSTSESGLNAIEGGYKAISFSLSLILGLTVFGLIASVSLITNSGNGAQADLGVGVLLFSLGAGVSLIGFWLLLALLVSMHRLLFRILEELLIQNKDR